MNISKKNLEQAVSQNIISSEQAEELWDSFRSEVRATFDLSHIAYYVGALVVIAAMGWLMTNGWEKFGGVGISVLSVTYAACFSLVGWYLWNILGLKIPAGLLHTMAVCMTPLAIYGIEKATGFWPQGTNPGPYHNYYELIKGGWFLMEVGTVIVGLVALKYVPFPFLTAPIGFSLWYMSMDIAPLIIGANELAFQQRCWISLIFGLTVLLISYIIDRRTKEDYAFWLYLFGLMSFWGGLTSMESNNEWGKFAYCLINLALIVLAVFLERSLFLVFGAVGFFGYLTHLSYEVFKDSMMFPFALTIFGLSIIYLGIKYQRNRKAIEAIAIAIVPSNLKWLIPKKRSTQ